MHRIAQLDHRYLWHPFTQMRDWLRREPIVIAEGQGAVLRDIYGREYLDANASIWTNLHGHNHPKLNAAIRRQLGKIAHSSALGFANEPASLLAEKLAKTASPTYDFRFSVYDSQNKSARKSKIADRKLEKVFFSDDGSTALEVALKLAYEFTRRTRGADSLSARKKIAAPKFLSLEGGYHGDTIGAVALGHIDLFHRSYAGLLFPTDQVMAPYCYRCPFNRAKPERADAREYRKCNWECIGKIEQKFSTQAKKANPYAAFVFEPLMQGVAGMISQPRGWLRQAAEIARSHGALLVADEVMTGFGRTGLVAAVRDRRTSLNNISGSGNFSGGHRPPLQPGLFACHREGVQPDFLCLAKGLTGGYLPMAATLTTQNIFNAFLGKYEEFKTFFHGHSYTANQLGAAAALANLEILQSQKSIRARWTLERTLREELPSLWSLPNVGDIRQVGLIAGIELVKNWRTREPFALRERAGIRVCEAMARHGVLTRPIGNVIVLMPPYCTTRVQARRMVAVLGDAVRAALGS